MQTVIFAREFRWPLGDNREARYPPNVEIGVTNAVADAARNAGALKEEDAENGERSAQGD